MSIEAFQIASAVLGSATVGLSVVAYSLKSRLDASAAHVANLQSYVADQCEREGALIRERDELKAFYNKTKTQRANALKVAATRRKLRAEGKSEVEIDAHIHTETLKRTFDALQAAPLRPRAEVVANIRGSKAAQAVSSGG